MTNDPQPHINEALPQGTAAGEAKQQEAARLGPLQRFFGILLSPGETFEDINRRPTWLAPMIIGVIAGLGFMLFYEFVVQPDWTELIRQQIRRSPNAQMPNEEGMAIAVNITKAYLLVVGVIAGPIIYLIVGALFALGMMFFQAKTTFKKVLSVTAWSYSATSLIGTIVAIAVISVRGFENVRTVSFQNLGNLSATNLGVAVPSTAPAMLRSLAGSLDLFSIWILILLIMGLAIVGGSRSITKGKTAALVISLWVIYILIRAVLASVFGGA